MNYEKVRGIEFVSDTNKEMPWKILDNSRNSQRFNKISSILIFSQIKIHNEQTHFLQNFSKHGKVQIPLLSMNSRIIRILNARLNIQNIPLFSFSVRTLSKSCIRIRNNRGRRKIRSPCRNYKCNGQYITSSHRPC